MTYIIKNRKDGKRITYWIISVSIFIFLLVQYFWPSFIPSIFTTIATPYWRTEFVVKSGGFHSVNDLLRENESLKREIANSEARLAIIQSVEDENLELRNLLKISSSTGSIVVPVIKKPVSGLYDQFIVDAGKDRGVSTTSLVYALGDIPIGKVADVFSQTSKVILFYSPGQKHNVLLANKIPATAVGRGGGQYEASVPRGLDLKIGDFVYHANIDAKPMGQIVYIDSNASLPFEKVLFSTPINVYELRWVSIDIDKKDNE